MGTTNEQAAAALAGLPEAMPTAVAELSDGDHFDLRIAPVAKTVGGARVRMLAYNGSIPGPVLRVRQGSQVVVDIENQGDMETTVHWHGLRLENRYDGTHQTQAPVPVGERFSAVVAFPDPGVYWYHPHIRSDFGIEMGLYGGIVVDPVEPGYWPPVNGEVLFTLDDLLLQDGEVARFSPDEPTHSAMGRFGDVILVNGETDQSMTARLGEVLRFYLVNTANTRVFNVELPGTRMKLVGGDSGHVEREEWVDAVVLAPSERVVVDVLFGEPGDLEMVHRTPDRVYPLVSITVTPAQVEPSLAGEYEVLRANADMMAERTRIQRYVEVPPDKTISFLAEMSLPAPEGHGPVVYTCPMHPEVVSETPGQCPKCAMKLVATAATSTYACPMHPEVVSDAPGSCPKCAMKLVPKHLLDAAGGHAHSGSHGPSGGHGTHGGHGQGEHGHAAEAGPSPTVPGGIEWEDDMVEVNRITTPRNFRWKIVDQSTHAENADIDWRFRVGDQVKIRLVNEMAGDHPMHHPFHIHGAGRFLVLSRDGTVEPNLVWKDTVLVRTGETVDILLDVTEPGIWMAHCHIAEHHETGMMFSFEVTE